MNIKLDELLAEINRVETQRAKVSAPGISSVELADAMGWNRATAKDKLGQLVRAGVAQVMRGMAPGIDGQMRCTVRYVLKKAEKHERRGARTRGNRPTAARPAQRSRAKVA